MTLINKNVGTKKPASAGFSLIGILDYCAFKTVSLSSNACGGK